MHIQTNNLAGPSNTGTKRFVVQSSDVIQDMRVNVSEENSEKVIWYKERFLGDDEIIENVVHNSTTTICWTIHRPKRGWYIRIRSPMFPPGVFIPLTPLPSSSPYHVDASLCFKSRTSLPPPATQFTHHDDDSVTSVHSYPPTPISTVPPVVVRPPSPGPSSHENETDTPGPLAKRRQQKRVPQSQISSFILSPSSIPPTHQSTAASFFTRALSVLKSHAPSHSNSFTLSRVPPPSSGSSTPQSPPPPYASTVPLATAADLAASSSVLNLPIQDAPPPLHPPLLTFHDRTPVLTVGSLTGLIEIDRAEEKLLGVDTSFWIAVGLTYLEFLEERESYLAALSD